MISQCQTSSSPRRHILETSQVDYVLFEAAGLIKDGLVREWRSVSKEEVAAMRAYLLAYVINRPTLSGYVRERLVQVRQLDVLDLESLPCFSLRGLWTFTKS